jgi:hypothetical protein
MNFSAKQQIADLIMFLGYGFDLLGKKHKRIWRADFYTLLEKVLRFAGFEETKLHYEAKTTTD